MAETYSATSRLSTEAASLNPVQIARNVQQNLVRNLPWLGGGICSVENFTLPGTVWQEAQAPSLTMSALADTSTTAGMGDASVAFLLSHRQLTATLYAVDVVWNKVALEAVQGDLQSHVIMAGERASYNLVDSLCTALYTEAPSSGPDHEIGTAGVPWDWALILAGIELLGVQNAPAPYTLVSHTSDMSALLTIPELNEAQIFGRAVIEKGFDVETGRIAPSTNNINCYVSNNVVQSAGNNNMIFSKNAIGIRVKQGFTAAVDATKLNVSPRVLVIGMEMWLAVGGLRDTSTTNKYMVHVKT